MGKIISSSIVSKHGVVEVIELGEHRACDADANAEDGDEDEALKSERAAGGEHLTRPAAPGAARSNGVVEAEEEAEDEPDDCRSLLAVVGEVHRNKRLYSLEDVGEVEARECFMVLPKKGLVPLVLIGNEVVAEVAELALELPCVLLLLLIFARFLVRGMAAIEQSRGHRKK